MPGNFFEFSRRERVGIASLLSLIVLLQFFPSAWHIVFYHPPFADTSGFHQAASEVAALMETEREAASRRYAEERESRYGKNFYRNDSGRYDGKFFRNNGSRYGKGFYRNDSNRYNKGFDREDGKYYGRNFYRDDTSRYRKTFHKDNERMRPAVSVIDINTADSAQWESLPGIGPALAKRIVGFRERLGGFYGTGQVGEVYGLADSVFKKIQPFLRHSDVSLRKISLNETDEKSLAQHPYINTNLARMIVRYRSARGPFRDVEALKGLALVDDSIYRKIEKYLKVN